MPHIGIAAVTVAQTTLCDFQLDAILQPHCLARSESDKLSGKYNYSELLSRCVRLMKLHSLRM